MTPPLPSPQLQRAERGFWASIEHVHTNVAPAELRQLVLGLVFLRYLSELFEAKRAGLLSETRDPRSVYFRIGAEQREALLERQELYCSAKVCFVPQQARWARLRAAASQLNIGRLVDAAVLSIEKANPHLTNVFPRDYARPELGREALIELLSLVGQVGKGAEGWLASDVLKVICEGFASTFVAAANQNTVVPLQASGDLRAERPHPPFSKLLERLDDQLQQLDRLLKESQQLRGKLRPDDEAP
jgi:type I restriction enzyme M protein